MKKSRKLAKKVDVTGRKKVWFFLHNFGKLILDGAKLSFASLVLGSIIKGSISQEDLLRAGVIVSGAGALLGLIFVTIFEEK